MTTSAIVLIVAICEMLKSILLSPVDPPYEMRICAYWRCILMKFIDLLVKTACQTDIWFSKRGLLSYGRWGVRVRVRVGVRVRVRVGVRVRVMVRVRVRVRVRPLVRKQATICDRCDRGACGSYCCNSCWPGIGQ